MKIRTLKSGIEIVTDKDDYGQTRHTAVDPKGYIGRTQICTSWDYRAVLSGVRNYLKNNKR